MDRGQTVFGVAVMIALATVFCTGIVKFNDYWAQTEIARQKVLEESQRTEQAAINAGVIKGNFAGWIRPEFIQNNHP